eukprot:COSAG04_NODE_9583_length_850_cov_0.946738_1_plen_70_part_10
MLERLTALETAPETKSKMSEQQMPQVAEQGRALLDAAKSGDCDGIGRLIDGGLDVNALVESERKKDSRGQ